MREWHAYPLKNLKHFPDVVGVYLIDFRGTPYKYVGASVHTRQRIKEHVYQMKQGWGAIGKVYREGGWSEIEITILDECDISELWELETGWIEIFSAPLDYQLLNVERYGKQHRAHKIRG